MPVNPYGIPGSQGPSINIPAAAQAVRGRDNNRPTAKQDFVATENARRVGEVPPYDPLARVPRQNPERVVYHGFEQHWDNAPPGQLYPWGRSSGGGPVPNGQSSQLSTDSYGGLNYQSPPDRIPRLWKGGLHLQAGLSQWAFTQANYTLPLINPLKRNGSAVTRGLRSISGVLSGAGPTASTRRIPALFVPSQSG